MTDKNIAAYEMVKLLCDFPDGSVAPSCRNVFNKWLEKLPSQTEVHQVSDHLKTFSLCDDVVLNTLNALARMVG